MNWTASKNEFKKRKEEIMKWKAPISFSRVLTTLWAAPSTHPSVFLLIWDLGGGDDGFLDRWFPRSFRIWDPFPWIFWYGFHLQDSPYTFNMQNLGGRNDQENVTRSLRMWIRNCPRIRHQVGKWLPENLGRKGKQRSQGAAKQQHEPETTGLCAPTFVSKCCSSVGKRSPG